MELDWMTVALEILNFLVLVWLLKRFFYQPVLAVIEQRRTACEKIVSDAQLERSAAETLKGELRQRLDGIGQMREQAQARLDGEIAAERVRRLAAVEDEVNTDRQRRQTLAEQESRQRGAAMEQQALMLAARFVSRVLEHVASPDLDARLVDFTLAGLASAEAGKLTALTEALRDPGLPVKVLTAYPLDETRRAAFATALSTLAGRAVTPAFAEDATLKAGLCLMVGAWGLMANLRDEFGYFTGVLEHGD